MHVAIIMDGNRRFAKKLMLEPWKGHEYGVKKFEEILDWCKSSNVSELTLYTFSIQNFNRPKHEFEYLMNLARKEYSRYLEEGNKLDEHGIQARFLGRLDLFPQDIQDMCNQIQERTKNNTSYKLNFCLGYGGREEMVDAMHLIAKDVQDGKVQPTEIDEDLIDKYVYMKDQPDFIIRTGGDHRTSNFLIWQSAYSEWFFVDKMFPELDKEDFTTILDDFKKRDRRFGK